jgi:hypothetical protein
MKEARAWDRFFAVSLASVVAERRDRDPAQIARRAAAIADAAIKIRRELFRTDRINREPHHGELFGAADLAGRQPIRDRNAVLRQIDEAWQAGEPYTASTSSKRYVVTMMIDDHGWSKVEARNLVKDWRATAVLVSAERARKIFGLKVNQWPTPEAAP